MRIVAPRKAVCLVISLVLTIQSKTLDFFDLIKKISKDIDKKVKIR